MASNSSQNGAFGGFQSMPSDNDYLAQIEQYKDKPFYQYLLQNPWMFSKQQEFTPNFWQQIGEGWLFNDLSARNKYYGEIQNNQNQWLSEALERFRQEEYNSAEQQAARQRDAGLNPDLAPGSVSSGSAAENDQPLQSLGSFAEPSNPLDVVGTLGSFFVKAYSFASGIAKDMFSMKSMNLENLGKENSLVQSIRGSAESYLRDSITTPHKDENGNWVFPDLSMDALDSYADSMYKSSKSRKMFKKSVYSAYNSARTLASQWTDISNAEDARIKMADSIGRNVAYGADSNYNQDPLITISSELNKMNLDIQKAQQRFQKGYNETVSGEVAGEAVNASNKSVTESYDAQKYNREVDKIVNESINRIVKSLSKSAESGDWSGNLAKGLLLLFSAYRSNLIPSLPNLNGLIQNKNFYNSTTNIENN